MTDRKRWWGLVALALMMAALAPAPARAGEQTRVDLFDAQGRRTGHALVDKGTGRIDFYDTMSRRTGYGRVDGAGRAERFGLDGKRQGNTAVPASPRPNRPR